MSQAEQQQWGRFPNFCFWQETSKSCRSRYYRFDLIFRPACYQPVDKCFDVSGEMIA